MSNTTEQLFGEVWSVEDHYYVEVLIIGLQARKCESRHGRQEEMHPFITLLESVKKDN